jgi:hypothetical protein
MSSCVVGRLMIDPGWSTLSAAGDSSNPADPSRAAVEAQEGQAVAMCRNRSGAGPTA